MRSLFALLFVPFRLGHSVHFVETSGTWSVLLVLLEVFGLLVTYSCIRSNQSYPLDCRSTCDPGDIARPWGNV